jgi:small-conductance mechanosensitive channel/nucleotide-binding universal stress UspA family protein
MFIDINQKIFNAQFSLGQFILFLVILILGIILSIAIPGQIAKYLTIYIFDIDKKQKKKIVDDEKLKEFEKQHEKELKKQITTTLIQPIKNLVGIIIFAFFGFIALLALGYTFITPFEISGYPFTFQQIILFILILIAFSLFVNSILPPLIRIALYAIIGRSVKTSELNDMNKRLLGPTSMVLLLIGLHVALFVSFPDTTKLPFYDFYFTIFILLSIILVTYFITSYFLAIFHIYFILPRKMDPHASVAFENLVQVVAFLFALGLIMTAFGVDLAQVTLALTFIGFAIAFGMQNTIANIMAGFTLAADKPFVIGDRIRVGGAERETWGDVIDIGLNTTTIRTVEEETVVIPNNYVASNEIWNFTKNSPIIAFTFHVGISYGSNWRLAKKIIYEEAQKHPHVLRKPQPVVHILEFADFAINMKIWVWIRNALDKEQIRSDLYEAIKDRFDAEGVEIPFPYRTIVHKTDLPKEKQLPIGVKFDNVRWYPSKGRDYFEVGEGPLKGIPVSKVVHEEDVKILTPVSGIHNAKMLAEYSMSLAQKIKGNVTALFIMKDGSKPKEMAGLRSLTIFERFGTKNNINVATKIEHGDVVDKILEVIDRDHINLVVIGGGRKAVLGKWGPGSIANEIIERSTVPVVTMPHKLKWV